MARDRYLTQDQGQSFHRLLGEYFLDLWSSAPKPCGSAAEGKPRFVTPQPLSTEISASGKDTDTRRWFNLRRLNELPFHLLKSQRIQELKSSCLCNFEFLLTKLSAISLGALFEDIQMALASEPTDQDIRYVSDTLHLACAVLERDSEQLASQLIGRLHDLVAADVPVAPGDPPKYPFLKSLLRDAQKSSARALIPSRTCLIAPGGILFDIMSGHAGPVTAVVTTSDGHHAVTTSKDNTLKLWELKTGRVKRTITGVGTNVRSVRLALSNSAAITSDKKHIRVFSLRTGEMMTSIDMEDPACITTALDGSLLVAFSDGSCVMRVWNLREIDNDKAPLVQELRVNEEEPVHRDNSILCAPTSHGTHVSPVFGGTATQTQK